MTLYDEWNLGVSSSELLHDCHVSIIGVTKFNQKMSIGIHIKLSICMNLQIREVQEVYLVYMIIFVTVYLHYYFNIAY